MAKDKASRRDVTSLWLIFITNLPVDDASARMRILRTLESLGCAVLREGVFLLPESAGSRQSLARLTEYIDRSGGSSHIMLADALDEAQNRNFESLFDRSAKYEELTQKATALSGAVGFVDIGTLYRTIAGHRREYDALKAADRFHSPAQDKARAAIGDAEARIHQAMFPVASSTATVANSHFLGRIWATRKPLWADRLASAWLIRRFIDPEARIVWLESSQSCPADAVGFAFEGAYFSNTRLHVTFEELMVRFSLNDSASLRRLATLIHRLETGDFTGAESEGIESLLKGAVRRSTGEDDLLEQAEKTFDLLYETLLQPSQKGYS